MNKRHDISVVIERENPDIMYFTEILPYSHRDTINLSEIHFEGYACFNNLMEKQYRRDVALWVKEELGSQQVQTTADLQAAFGVR